MFETYLFWTYLFLLSVGGGLLLVSWIVGELSDAVEGAVAGLDNALEAIGIDLIPDNLGGGAEGLGYGLIIALIFFGAVGLLTLGTFHATPIVSVGIALALAGAAGLGVMALVRRLKRGESGNAPVDEDYVGAQGHVTIAIPKGDFGVVLVSLGGQRTSLRAKSATGEGLEQGALIEITQKGGSICFVKRV